MEVLEQEPDHMAGKVAVPLIYTYFMIVSYTEHKENVGLPRALGT